MEKQPNELVTIQQKNIHAGHRQRLRQTFLAHGLDAMSDVNVLEFLLFYIYPRQDTNPIAHRLLDRFGSLSAVMSATYADLTGLGGLPETAAALILLIPDLYRRLQISALDRGRILDHPNKYGDFLVPYYIGARDECIYLLALDSRCRVIDCKRLSTGSVNCTALNIRAAVEYALRVKATSIVLSHNHTSGVATPSLEDVDTTRRLSQALATVGVHLADHIIVSGDDYVSMLESGYKFRDALPGAALSGTPL